MRKTHRTFAIAVPCIAGLLFVIATTIIFYKPARTAEQALAAGDYKTANTLFTTDAETGNTDALNALGNLSYLGLGVPQDFLTAAHWYFAAARNGHAAAQLNLGNLYKQGLGVPFDAMRAFAWYTMSDQHGNATAEIYLRQIAVEYTLSPLQINLASKKWRQLTSLVAEGL